MTVTGLSIALSWATLQPIILCTNKMDPVNQAYAVIGGNPFEGESLSTLKLFKNETDAQLYADQLKDKNDYEFAYVYLMNIN